MLIWRMERSLWSVWRSASVCLGSHRENRFPTSPSMHIRRSDIEWRQLRRKRIWRRYSTENWGCVPRRSIGRWPDDWLPATWRRRQSAIETSRQAAVREMRRWTPQGFQLGSLRSELWPEGCCSECSRGVEESAPKDCWVGVKGVMQP